MKKINYILTLLLLAIGVNWTYADDQTLALGNYDEVVDGEWNEDQTYQGSWWQVSPTQFNVKHTGTQIIYSKEQLASMAGKEIKGLSFAYYNQGAFSGFARNVNVWVKEIDNNEFAYDSNKKAYKYFEYSDATKAIADYSFDVDFSEYYCTNGEIVFNFDKPFAYSGDKNLLVTITFDGDDTSDSPTDIEFYYNTEAGEKAMATCSDQSSFADFNESEDWPYAAGGGSAISHASKLDQPLTKFTYQESSKPVVKPATLSGTVKCGENAVADATVTLTSGELKYEATSNSEGVYTIEIPADGIDNEYVLTATADKYEDYTATEPIKFASDEKKSLDIELTKKDVPSVLSGKVISSEDSKPLKDVAISVKNDAHEYTATTGEDGTYSVEVVKSEETYTLTAKLDGYEDKTVSDFTFTPGEPKTQDITLIKIDNPSTMLGKVTCNNEPVEGATVKLAAKDNKYITYTTTTSADGSYLLRVVKSEKTYTLTVTDGECEDYTENDITFTPGESTTKNIVLTKTPEPENCITLGKYDKMLKNGTGKDGEVYYGYGFSWAAVPTNFSHSNTGSQIIYTKEQLHKLNGKAINKINFVFHNESAYETYPRTVKVWVKETDDNAFKYDDKARAYKFFEYADATPAIAGYEYAGELYNYAGENGELELAFDEPLNYNGKNLVVTLTFEGENTCNVLDFNFYCNNDQKNKAMAYFSDSYSFDEYAETEDWPYTNDDCVSSMEQPVTRIFYTDATSGITDIASEIKATNAINGMTYNIAGQRVGNNYKGIAIRNGKKVVMK